MRSAFMLYACILSIRDTVVGSCWTLVVLLGSENELIPDSPVNGDSHVSQLLTYMHYFLPKRNLHSATLLLCIFNAV